MLISELLADKPPGKICLLHKGKTFSYGDLEEKSSLLARRLDIQKGDCVLVNLPDPLEQLLYFFAVAKAGGICILLPPGTPTAFTAQFMEKHGITHMITPDCLLMGKKKNLPPLAPDDIFLGALTSGSTGQAKLLWRDHQSWLCAFPHQSNIFSLNAGDTLYLPGYLAYTTNLNSCLHMLFAGGTVVFPSSRLPRRWVEELAEHQITALFMVPTNYRLLLKNLKQPLPAVRSVLSGGASLDIATINYLREMFPQAVIVEYYGAAELGHIAYSRLPERQGIPFPDVKISIKDSVIWVHSPYIVPALRPKATVGDLGELCPDGTLKVYGRGGNIINSGGLKINTEEIDDLLRTHPSVSDAAVLAENDGLRGQKICAFVSSADPALKSNDLLVFCRQHLNVGHCPQQILLLPELPLNTSGKTDRQQLKNLLDSENIKKLLPQREPFLFLDRLDTDTPSVIHGEKNYAMSFIFAQPSPGGGSHVPTAILLESLIQCGGAGVKQLGQSGGGLFALTALNKVKIYGVAILPTKITMTVYTKKVAKKLLVQSGQARMDGNIVLSAEWTCIAIEKRA